MKFKGTKSPWNQNGINGVHNLKGNCVAISEGTTKEEKKANALLISKAPEMLEMLIELRKIFDKYKVDHEEQFSKYKRPLEQVIKEATEIN